MLTSPASPATRLAITATTVALTLSLATGTRRLPAAEPAGAADAALSQALTFHASFDSGTTADHAAGDRTLYHAPSLDQRHTTTAGLPETGEVALAESPGRPGRALLFKKTKAPLMLFKADRNFPRPAPGWSGTLSFWLCLDPATDLDDGFCDPIQITSKKWDDAAIFVEFEKRATGIPFRLGVYADTPVWNPQGRKWEDIPQAEKPLVTVTNPPFSRDSWTHVAVTIDSFNTGQPDGHARLFLNGQPAGDISPRNQLFTWDPERAIIMLGVSYAGLLDDLALFNRALTPAEVARLHSLNTSVRSLHPKP